MNKDYNIPLKDAQKELAGMEFTNNTATYHLKLNKKMRREAMLKQFGDSSSIRRVSKKGDIEVVQPSQEVAPPKEE